LPNIASIISYVIFHAILKNAIHILTTGVIKNDTTSPKILDILNLSSPNSLTGLKLVIFIIISFILEILHFIIPNRAFEFYDLIANMLGVLIIIFIKKFVK